MTIGSLLRCIGIVETPRRGVSTPLYFVHLPVLPWNHTKVVTAQALKSVEPYHCQTHEFRPESGHGASPNPD